MNRDRERARQRIGERLGDWRLDDVLDVGGMAAVFRARHDDGTRVAIKLLRRDFGPETEPHQRFLREARAANKVEHPGAVKIVGSGVDDATESPYIVMELLDGESLDQRLARSGGRLAAPATLLVADGVLDVLSKAHASGIVHRDIKPGNVFLTRDGSVKILDFGFARVREAAMSTETTRDGVVIGTVSFMAPEQARAKTMDVDHRCDLWSLGATMFFALSGRAVHEGSVVDRLMKTMTQPAPGLASVVSDVAPEVSAVVDRALALEKEDRWPDAAAMRAAIRAAMDAVGASSSEPIPLVNRSAPPDASDEASVAFELVQKADEQEASTKPRLRGKAPPKPKSVTESMIEDAEDLFETRKR